MNIKLLFPIFHRIVHICADLKIFFSDEIEICTICLDVLFGRVWKTRCKHKFHYECLVQWAFHKLNCPNCRRLISMSEINIIYC